MTLREKIIGLLTEYGIDKPNYREVYNHYDELKNLGLINENTTELSFQQYVCHIRKYLETRSFYEHDSDNDLAEYNSKLHRESQRLKDLRRIETKDLREQERLANALLEANNELISVLKEYNTPLQKITKEHPTKESEYYGIINLSDLHFNELIDAESITNKYDFNIASTRLKKLAFHSKKIFSQYKIKTILIAMTGDMMNSDRRLDELLSMATNRTKATMHSCYLLEQFILDLNKNFNIKIASVVGNESRVKDEFGFSEIIASDSYDVMIDSILRIMFKNCKGIEFVDGGIIEKVVSLDGFNILLLHGDKLNQTSLERSVYSKIAKYAHKDVRIDYVLFGHLHEARIADYYARCSSLAGGNPYSDEGLNLISKASQNIFIINPKLKDIHGIKVDLQNTVGTIGYTTIKDLEEYNSKSVSKLQENKVIVQVVV